jgi:uncharacterized protein (TIGR02217 family)
MMSAFHEIRFPARVALGATGGPVRRTDIVNLSNGREQRNQRWCDSRRSYDVGTGIRSICDLYQVLEFFEARGGQLYGFRFRDPVDWVSCAPGGSISALDQVLGTGDGTQAVFALVKTYGDAGGAWTRRIAKPVAGTVVVSVDGAIVPQAAYIVDAVGGNVTFGAGHVPGAGSRVCAGFAFDVPVRFDLDRIDINLQHFDAGRIPTIPLTEILP